MCNSGNGLFGKLSWGDFFFTLTHIFVSPVDDREIFGVLLSNSPLSIALTQPTLIYDSWTQGKKMPNSVLGSSPGATVQKVHPGHLDSLHLLSFSPRSQPMLPLAQGLQTSRNKQCLICSCLQKEDRPDSNLPELENESLLLACLYLI